MTLIRQNMFFSLMREAAVSAPKLQGLISTQYLRTQQLGR